MFTITFSQSVSASTIKEESPINLSNQVVDYENLQIQEPDGSILIFDNLSDMMGYVNAFKQSDKSSQSIILPTAYPITVVGTQYKNYQFMGYSKYTTDWQKNSQYTVQVGDSQSFSKKINTKWGDVSVSYTHTQGVTRTIPADASRWSRLAGYADIKVQRMKLSQHNVGTIYYNKVTTLNTYTDVRYK